MNEFDLKAKDWDDNLRHVDRARSVAASIRKNIPIHDKMSALEYGAGTGLLSMELRIHLGTVVLMDNSEGMIRVTESKIRESGINNLKPVLWNLEKDLYDARFDFIYSLMVMHHVEDTDIILGRFYSMLNTGGFLAIADLYSEDGTFHGESFKGHYGFDPGDLGRKLLSIGFKNIKHEPCYNISKETSNGVMKDFPVFLLTAVKYDN